MNLRGFTLIEILVAVSVTLIIASTVVINYNSFNANQQVKQSALTFKNNLRYAQQKAKASEKGSNCSGFSYLYGYALQITSDTSYRVLARCTNDNTGATAPSDGIVIGTYTLPPGVMMSTASQTIDYQVLSRPVVGATTIIFSHAASDTTTYRIIISAGGDVSMQ